MRGTLGSNNRSNTNRIISFCGFDSIPSDLAIYVAVRALKKQANSKNEDADIQIAKGTTWHASFGSLNGGTLHTALDMPMDMSHCVYYVWGTLLTPRFSSHVRHGHLFFPCGPFLSAQFGTGISRFEDSESRKAFGNETHATWHWES